MRVLLGTLILILALSGQAFARQCPADAFVQSAGNAFMSAADRGTPQAFSNAASRYADLRRIALFALGQYRRNLPSDREGEYVQSARGFMGRFMAQYASHFSGDGISILSCDPAASGLNVQAQLKGGQTVTFRLRGSGGSYRVEDMSISNVWLAQAMRSKFTSIISQHGGDVGALLDWLDN